MHYTAPLFLIDTLVSSMANGKSIPAPPPPEEQGWTDKVIRFFTHPYISKTDTFPIDTLLIAIAYEEIFQKELRASKSEDAARATALSAAEEIRVKLKRGPNGRLHITYPRYIQRSAVGDIKMWIGYDQVNPEATAELKRKGYALFDAQCLRTSLEELTAEIYGVLTPNPPTPMVPKTQRWRKRRTWHWSFTAETPGKQSGIISLCRRGSDGVMRDVWHEWGAYDYPRITIGIGGKPVSTDWQKTITTACTVIVTIITVAETFGVTTWIQ